MFFRLIIIDNNDNDNSFELLYTVSTQREKSKVSSWLPAFTDYTYKYINIYIFIIVITMEYENDGEERR